MTGRRRRRPSAARPPGAAGHRGSRGPPPGAGRAGLRGRRPGRPSGRRRAGGALRPVRHEHPVRPPPPAAPRGAADRVRLRELLGAALGRRRVPADGQPHGVAPDFELPDDVWASFQIPIGLAFFMDSTTAGCVVALYPSPAGATESELHFASWSRMVELNPVLEGLEPDVEGLIVNRLVRPAGATPSRRSTAATRSTGTIKAQLGGHLRRRGGAGGGRRRSSTSSRPRRSAHEHPAHRRRPPAGAAPDPAAPEPEFEVLGARAGALRGGARRSPSTSRSRSRAGAEVYMIALTIQVMIEPARRSYDADTRERLVGAVRAARALVGRRPEPRLGPARRGRAGVHRLDDGRRAGRLQLRPRGRVGEVPARAVRRRGAARACTSTASSTTRATTAGCRWCSSPGRARSRSGCRWRSGRETIEHYYPNTGWVAVRSETLEALRARHASSARPRRSMPRWPSCWESTRWLRRSRSWSTPCCGRATRSIRTRRERRRTPRRRRSGSSTRPRMRPARRARSTTSSCGACVEPAGEAVLAAEVRFLAAAGGGHAAVRRLELPPSPAADVASSRGGRVQESRRAAGRSAGRRPPPGRMAAAGRRRSRSRCASRTAPRAAEGSTGRRRCSARCSRPIRCSASRAGVSSRPWSAPCASVNTYARARDPGRRCGPRRGDRPAGSPQIAPESRGGLFDSTEIEEALLLHVQVLSDAERDEIEQADPAVREMVARAAAATPEEIAALHGRVTLRDPRDRSSPPEPPPGLADPSAGQAEATVDGVDVPPRRPRPHPAGARRRPARPAARGAARRRSSASSSTTTARRISASPLTAIPARSSCARRTGFLFFFAPEVEVVEP